MIAFAPFAGVFRHLGLTPAQLATVREIARRFGFTAADVLGTIAAASLERPLAPDELALLRVINRELGVAAEMLRP
jgi:hypothetical protein